MARKTKTKAVMLKPRLRALCGGETVLGPGRVDLLELIAETGSLRAAASEMGMSYMRAWKIAKSVNKWFHPKLIEFARGGAEGGGAKLTAAGREVVRLYRRMERQTERSVAGSWKRLRHLLNGAGSTTTSRRVSLTRGLLLK